MTRKTRKTLDALKYLQSDVEAQSKKRASKMAALFTILHGQRKGKS